MTPDQAVKQGQSKVFRLPGAIVAWWAWVLFAAANLIDLAIQGRSHTALEIAVTLLAITGLVYACALRPRVVADSSGINVRNPLRDHQIPWGTVTGVDLKESVRVHCASEPGASRGKAVHSWALYAQRRNRLRSELLAQTGRRRLPRMPVPGDGLPPGHPDSRMSAEAQKIANQSAAQVMADQLDKLARDARERGAPAGPRVATWAWQPIAAIVAPAIVLILVVSLFH